MNNVQFDEDTKDFLTDLEQAARSPEASDEWLAGFVRQYYGVPQYQKQIAATPRKLSFIEKAVITLAAGTAFGIMSLAYNPNSIPVALVATGLGFVFGFVAATLDRHK
jgi:hypothetical protein